MSRASDLKHLFEAERVGDAFLVYRDDAQRQHIVPLVAERLTVGRRRENDVVLGWDIEVSRVHAEFERVGGEWTVSDEGLSANGTWVGSERVTGRRRLRDGDIVRIGATLVEFHYPNAVAIDAGDRSTLMSGNEGAAALITPAQMRVLAALCRPLRESPGFAVPASNQEIADELVLGVESVRTHLRALFQSFGVDDLPQNQKRAALADRALRQGLVRD